MQQTDHIHIKGLNFFACTLYVDDAAHITIEDCNVLYPSYSKRMLKEIHKPQPTTLRGDHNNLINCTFKYADGTGLLLVETEAVLKIVYSHRSITVVWVACMTAWSMFVIQRILFSVKTR